MTQRPVPVLVHSPLVGPATWQPVADVLRARGERPVVPSLTDAVRPDAGPYIPRIAAAVAEAVASGSEGADGDGDGGPLVLVAHSGAGPLLPALAAAVRRPVAGAVYVDAGLPHPGRSWFETAPAEMAEQLRGLAGPDGRLPPWDEWFPPGTIEELLPDPDTRARFRAELPRLPLAYFAEPTPPEPPADPDAGAGSDPDAGAGPDPDPDTDPEPAPQRTGYLRLSEAYESEAERAAHQGRHVRHLATHHLAMLTQPTAVADALTALTSALTPDP